MAAYHVSVFISHSWAYSDHYQTLSEWLFQKLWNSEGTQIILHDTSVPKHDPIHAAPTSEALRRAIYERIAQADVVVIPTGMYANHSDWIQKEIDGAKLYGKPIVAVNPWAQERKSSVVMAASDRSVGWNSQTLVNAVWSLAPRVVR